MSILWAGGEDIDFPIGPGAITTQTNPAGWRSGYARAAVYASGAVNNYVQSKPFAAGALTSAWLTCRHFWNGSAGVMMFGLGRSGTVSGLYLGAATTSATKFALFKYDGTTKTQLAAETGTSLAQTTPQQKLDMQVSNYGASATVNIYLNGTLLFTFSGDVTVTGMSNFDCVTLPGGSGLAFNLSEMIVADEDTRTFWLVTLAPNAAGDTDTWTGTFSSVNPTQINDANAVFTNTAAQDEQFNCTNLPAGTFAIKSVLVKARAQVTAGAAVSQVSIGVKTASSIAAGATVSPTSTFTTYEASILATNPVTTAAWLSAEIDALQINLRSS